MHMHPARTIRLGLALTGLCALGLTAARPAAAQDLLYTLSGVTFFDGATASGFFIANATTGVFSALDLTTTNGPTDGSFGKHYVLSATTTGSDELTAFYLQSGSNTLRLYVYGDDRIPGVHSLQQGSFTAGDKLVSSGEYTPFVSSGGGTSARPISAGSLVVSAPVPEASTTVSFGLLLALSAGGLMIAAKRKKAQSAC